jgi:AhpD family alkylhydroperoxidase
MLPAPFLADGVDGPGTQRAGIWRFATVSRRRRVEGRHVIVARIEPLSPRQWPPEMREALAPLTPPQPLRPGRPRGLNVLGTMAHHPALAKAFNLFNSHVLYSSTLTPRQRELLVLRVAAVRQCEYEWLQHAVLSQDVGITPDEVARIAAGHEGFSPFDAALLTAADELIDDAKMSDATWAVLSETLSEQQLLDIVFTVGCYDMLAMAMGSTGIEVDDDLRNYVPESTSAEQAS